MARPLGMTLRLPRTLKPSKAKWSSATERARFNASLFAKVEKSLATLKNLSSAKVRVTASGTTVVSDLRSAGSMTTCLNGEVVIIVWQYDHDRGTCNVLSVNRTGISCADGSNYD